MITGSQIANHTIRSRDVKNGTLWVGDLSPRARAALAGQDGVPGPQGQPGTDGADGSANTDLRTWDVSVPAQTSSFVQVTGASALPLGTRVVGLDIRLTQAFTVACINGFASLLIQDQTTNAQLFQTADRPDRGPILGEYLMTGLAKPLRGQFVCVDATGQQQPMPAFEATDVFETTAPASRPAVGYN